MLSGYSEPENWNELIVAPLWLRKKLLKLIERETENAKAGRPASITAKMNSLCDKEIIDALYEASANGVKTELIVRGICCLRPGVAGLSENISVRSIVGNFLEHARIMRFENNGDPLYYMGSADWMPRNLDRRVEIVFPVLEKEDREMADHILRLELMDNVKASVMQPDGSYEKQDLRGKKKVDSQLMFCREAEEAAERIRSMHDPEKTRTFIPCKAE